MEESLLRKVQQMIEKSLQTKRGHVHKLIKMLEENQDEINASIQKSFSEIFLYLKANTDSIPPKT